MKVDVIRLIIIPTCDDDFLLVIILMQFTVKWTKHITLSCPNHIMHAPTMHKETNCSYFYAFLCSVNRLRRSETRESFVRLDHGAQCPFSVNNDLHRDYRIKDSKVNSRDVFQINHSIENIQSYNLKVHIFVPILFLAAVSKFTI